MDDFDDHWRHLPPIEPADRVLWAGIAQCISSRGLIGIKRAPGGGIDTRVPPSDGRPLYKRILVPVVVVRQTRSPNRADAIVVADAVRATDPRERHACVATPIPSRPCGVARPFSEPLGERIGSGLTDRGSEMPPRRL